MKAGMKVALGLLAALLAVSVAGLVTASGNGAVQEEKKLVKPVRAYGKIEGQIGGLRKGAASVRLELFRVENEGLVSVANTETGTDGAFRFLTLEPGAYLVMPDLASIPAGFGLTQRLASIRVGTEPVAVRLTVREIRQLEIRTPSPEVLSGEPFVVETAAFDAEGQYLFADAEVTLPGEAVALERSGNGARARLDGKGRPVVISARNGQASANITLKVVE